MEKTFDAEVMPPTDPVETDPTHLRSRLGGALRRAREKKHLAQDKCAVLAGIDRSHLGYIERGQCNCTFKTLMKMLQSLSIEPYTFFQDPSLRLQPAGQGSSGPDRRRPCRPLPSAKKLPYAKILGAALRYEREGICTAQQALADRVGMARGRLSDIEHGRGNPSIALLLRIVQALGMQPAVFFGHVRLRRPLPLAGAGMATEPRAAAGLRESASASARATLTR